MCDCFDEAVSNTSVALGNYFDEFCSILIVDIISCFTAKSFIRPEFMFNLALKFGTEYCNIKAIVKFSRIKRYMPEAGAVVNSICYTSGCDVVNRWRV